MSGLEFLRELRESNGHGPLVIIVTAHGSERMAVEAVKAGAYDYLSKPFELDDLRLVVKNAQRRFNFVARTIHCAEELKSSVLNAVLSLETRRQCSESEQ
jgi:Response regulator containing CheY-like receiver, AAA-type ATPase, and DNA-binding domains